MSKSSKNKNQLVLEENCSIALVYRPETEAAVSLAKKLPSI
jgi:hypothetical protein